MSVVPRFVVVGHTNEGKSSILSTLAADDSVRIEARAGTTHESREFPIQVDGKTILVLVDTPGFENARRMLDWLEKNKGADEAPIEVVRRFLDVHSAAPEFENERKLLEPVLDGSGVLYVVDASHPVVKRFSAEMEILRWTGQPRMALLNDKGEGQYVDAWTSELDQYFNLVRYFNAHKSDFRRRVDVLTAIRELREEWRSEVDGAISALMVDRSGRVMDAARILADGMVGLLTHVEEQPVAEGKDVEDYRSEILDRFHSSLRTKESACRTKIEELFDHYRIEREESDLGRPDWEQDLFAKSTWRTFGLTPKQLVAAGTAAGAATGGVLDAMVGGASFGAGMAVGGVLGFIGALAGVSDRFVSKVKLLQGVATDSEIFQVGPHTGRNFPWVVLNRALIHYRAVASRAHSVRDALALDFESNRVTDELSFEARRGLQKLFERIQGKGVAESGQRRELIERLHGLLESLNEGGS